MTDYTEPQNLFALAVNSPPNQGLNGSCGAGPEGDQLGSSWYVKLDEDSGHFLIDGGARRGMRKEVYELPKRNSVNLKSKSSYSMLSNKARSWL